MAIEQPETTLTLSGEERTWRVEIFCEKGQDPTIVAHRETIKSDANGNVVTRERGVTVRRTGSGVATDTITVGNLTITGAQLAAVVAAAADKWRSYDLANPAPVGPLRVRP
jgi:hypothetical protein